MIIRYSSLNRLEKPQFTLCNPGSVCRNGLLTNVVGMLTDTEAEEIVFNFNATSELNLRVNHIRRDSAEENAHIFALFKAVQNRRLIHVRDIGYFMITNIEDGFDGYLHYKDVTAQSIDIEIAQKMVPFIENGTYRFLSNESDEKGIFELVVGTLPLWTIGYVDPAVAEKYRTFEDVDVSTNCLAFLLEDIQDAYECIIIFDIVNRIINVYDQNNYVRQTNIHITKDDLINSLDITENADDLYTAISVMGNDNVTISAINPIGTNTIYDFSHYLEWMSPELRERVSAWQDEVRSNTQRYYDLNLEYYQKMAETSDLNMELDRLDTQILMYSRCRDNIVADSNFSNITIESYNKAIVESGGSPISIGSEVSYALAQIDRLIAECEEQKEEVGRRLANIEDEISSYTNQISTIQTPLSPSKYFTADEYAELSNYIYEGSYTDDYVIITDIMTYDEKFAQMKTLYDRADSQLSRVSRPTQEFSIDVENFIFAKEFEEWSEQLETGCLINVELDINDIAALFLSNMTINYDDHSLKMTFGNRFNKFDTRSLYRDVLGQISKSANTLSYVKDLLYPIKSGEFNYMQEALQSSRNLTMGAAFASENQSVVIDGSGYTGRQMLGDGSYDPRQVKIVNNSIVFTDDAWKACEVALGQIILGDGTTTYGLNAKTIIGEMIIGGQLNIYDKDGNELLTVIDNRIELSVGASVSEKLGDYYTKAEVDSSIKVSEGSIKAEVSKTFVTKDEFSDTEIGARNLIRNSINMIYPDYYFVATSEDNSVLGSAILGRMVLGKEDPNGIYEFVNGNPLNAGMLNAIEDRLVAVERALNTARSNGVSEILSEPLTD